jgi:hypothetical protein
MWPRLTSKLTAQICPRGRYHPGRLVWLKYGWMGSVLKTVCRRGKLYTLVVSLGP